MLVASDAVGMGLNLCIRRIVFSSMEKFDGKKTRLLTTAVSWIDVRSRDVDYLCQICATCLRMQLSDFVIIKV